MKFYQIKKNIQLINQQVQTSHFNRQITDCLNIGQQHFKGAQISLPTNNIEDIIEQIDLSYDINQLLSTPIPTTDLTINDIELQKELNHLNNDIILNNLTEINLPSAHSGTIKLSKSSINDQDKQLEGLRRG